MELAPTSPAKTSAPAEAAEPEAFTASVRALRDLCADDLADVDAAILASLRSPVSMIPEVAGHLINAGGKRLRPLLTLASARACGVTGRDHITLAAAVELIHGATLLHDDVVDGSTLRRGLATANVLWGNKESVLVGDFIFSRAFELMVEAKDLSVLQILSRASGVIAEGEVLQLGTQKNLAATYDMYLSVVESKTAALFAAAAEVGAVVGGAARAVCARFGAFGRHLGVAFQLVDDALDYSGREAALGKAVGDDFREGKMTAPVVLALRRAGEAERAFWRRTIEEGRQTPEDFPHACALIEAAGGVEDTLQAARDVAQKAVDALREAPRNVYADALYAVARASAARAY